MMNRFIPATLAACASAITVETLLNSQLEAGAEWRDSNIMISFAEDNSDSNNTGSGSSSTGAGNAQTALAQQNGSLLSPNSSLAEYVAQAGASIIGTTEDGVPIIGDAGQGIIGCSECLGTSVVPIDTDRDGVNDALYVFDTRCSSTTTCTEASNLLNAELTALRSQLDTLNADLSSILRPGVTATLAYIAANGLTPTTTITEELARDYILNTYIPGLDYNPEPLTPALTSSFATVAIPAECRDDTRIIEAL